MINLYYCMCHLPVKVLGFIILVMIVGWKNKPSIYSYAALVLDCCARSSSYATLLFETTSSPPPWIHHGENAVCLTCHCIASCSDDIADNIAGFLSLQSLLSLNPKISTHATLKSTADTKKSRKYWKRNHDKSCSVSIHRAPCSCTYFIMTSLAHSLEAYICIPKFLLIHFLTPIDHNFPKQCKLLHIAKVS